MKSDNGTYIRPHQRYSWWLSQNNYFKYMLRELSSLFIGMFTLILISGLWNLSQGIESYSDWAAHLWDNLFWLSVLCFIFATYHSITWFWVTPKAMPFTFKGRPVSGTVIIAAHIFGWIAVSILAWLMIMGGFS